ncbi:cytidylate kinase-like family protein [Oscillospiraceae bacterium CM]|nr:cytidylate kinase-like family protein [Oscillospiraceae bacterium CM]
MEKFILAISREFGSGGRQVGEKLAARLGVEFYDKAIIRLAVEKSGLPYDLVEQSEEHIPSSLLYNFPAEASYDALTVSAFFDTPVNDKTFQSEALVLRELSKNSCVIVGRCADYILKDDPAVIKIYLSATLADRASRAVSEYGFPAEKALEKIRRIDKSRANYYKYYTGQNWGNIHNYDLVINTSTVGISAAVSIILALLEEKGFNTQAF